MRSFHILTILFAICHANGLRIRIITWNVADNKHMLDGFSNDALDIVLGTGTAKGPSPDIYAIGVQEQCWKCNEENFPLISNKFLGRIRKKSDDYVVVHTEGTRESRFCQTGCSLGTHGTTLLILIARKGLVQNFKDFIRNDGCSSTLLENDEKGIAAMQIELNSGLRLCFGSAHLDSASPKTRRACLKSFFEDANKKHNWSSLCDHEFLFGDFNTRTSGKGKESDGARFVSEGTDFTSLRVNDEMQGKTPYGTDSEWRQNLMEFINSVQRKIYIEAPLKFVPTYSVLPAEKCSGQQPCYRSNRPLSWTDRVIFTSGKVLEYQAVKNVYGDHFPVYAIFEI